MDKTDEEIAVEIGGTEQQIGQQCRRRSKGFEFCPKRSLWQPPTGWLPGLLDREASDLRSDGGENQSDRRPLRSRQYGY
jgi:hypothetical protein